MTFLDNGNVKFLRKTFYVFNYRKKLYDRHYVKKLIIIDISHDNHAMTNHFKINVTLRTEVLN